MVQKMSAIKMVEKSVITPTKTKYPVGVFMAAFFACIMFALGVIVGRGISPVQFDVRSMEDKLFAGTSGEPFSGTVTQDKKVHLPASVQKEPELKFYKSLEENSEEIRLNQQAAQAETKKSVIKKKQGVVKKQIMQEEKKAKPSGRVEQHDIVKPAVSEKKPEAIKKSGNYAVQVAALKSSDTAADIAIKLNKKKFPVYIERSRSGDNIIWHRVKIGPYKTKSDAEKVLIQLKLNKVDGFITGS